MDDVAERAEPDDQHAVIAAIRCAQQIARRVILRIADDRGASAVGRDDRSLGHGVDRVVGAFAVHVGPKPIEQGADGGVAKIIT